MKNKDITDFFPFENYATFDIVRKLKWDNYAILQAILYIRTIEETAIDYDGLMEKLTALDYTAVIACLFGAATSADKNITFAEFGKIYKEDFLHEYIKAVFDGIKAYLPEAESMDDGEDLDESYPDTQREAAEKMGQSKTPWEFWVWIAKSKLGMSLKEFGGTTLRAIHAIYYAWLKDNGMEQYDDGDV